MHPSLPPQTASSSPSGVWGRSPHERAGGWDTRPEGTGHRALAMRRAN